MNGALKAFVVSREVRVAVSAPSAAAHTTVFYGGTEINYSLRFLQNGQAKVNYFQLTGKNRVGRCHCWQDGGSKDYINARDGYYATHEINATLDGGSA